MHPGQTSGAFALTTDYPVTFYYGVAETFNMPERPIVLNPTTRMAEYHLQDSSKVQHLCHHHPGLQDLMTHLSLSAEMLVLHPMISTKHSIIRCSTRILAGKDR